MSALPIFAGLLAATSLLIPSFGFPAVAHAEDANSQNERAREQAGFDAITLRKPGVILMAASGDLNGDGKTDLLLFHKPSKESYEKSCSVYFQREGAFTHGGLLEIPLGETIGAVDIKDIDSDGMDELCCFDAAGMTVFGINAESSFESVRALKHQTLLPPASRHIVGVNWIADLDSDGRMDALLPVADGMRLFAQKEHMEFTESRTFDLKMRARVSGESGQNYVSYRLPAVEFSDFDEDGHTDIGAFDLEQMTFFLTGGSPAPRLRVEAPLVKKFTKDYVAATSFPDLNADGVPDSVLVLMSQKKNLQSEARVYFGREDFSYGEKPAHVYSGDANLILPMFLDATGDGKMEMLLQNINVGFGFFLNYFLRNRIRVDTELRRLSSKDRYEKEPAVRRAIYVRVSESGTEPARGIGDFNGDGLDDLVVGTAEDRLSFFLSNRKVILPRRPTFEVRVPAYGNMKVMNLNNDARADIVILYPQEDKLGTATLLLSK